MRKYIQSMLMGLICLAAVSCKNNDLEEFNPIKNQDRTVSGAGIISGNIVKDNETVKVPFKIALSGPASKAFQVAVSLNSDTVKQLIANGTLINTVLLPNGVIDYPNVVNVGYGDDTATGVVSIRLSALELNYGKNVAFAIKLSNPEKGNQLKGGQSNILVVLKTAAIIKENELHYLSFLNGGTILGVEHNKNYTVTPAGIIIPLTVNLAGQAGSAFNINVNVLADTIATLVKNNVLPADAIALKPTQFTIDTMVRVNSNLNTVQIRLIIEWPVFDANIIPNKKFAFAISLTKPTKHILDPVKSKIIVLVDPNVNLDNNSYIAGSGTGLKAEYYANNQKLDFDGRKPTLVQIDDNIDFSTSGDDQGGWPFTTLIGRDNFSVRWTGEFFAPVNGEYTFYQTNWDDGARLYIDDKLLTDAFTDGGSQPNAIAKIRLERGKRYKLKVEYYENGGGQVARFEYEVPAASIGRRIVPRSLLFPAP